MINLLPLHSTHTQTPSGGTKPYPALGFGTYKISGEQTPSAIVAALKAGYRHIDTAQMYQNESGVGLGLTTGLAQLGLNREDIYLTTKLDNPNHEDKTAKASFTQSLTKLGVEYVDSFLIHWPMPARRDPHFTQTWRTLIEIWQSGAARSIGVSNFEIEHLELLEKETGMLPAVNQIEIHPSFMNTELRLWCQERGIIVEAWSPLGRGKDLEENIVKEIAQETGKSCAQIIVRYLLQCGLSVIPKSVTPQRIASNFAVFDFSLDEEKMARLATLDRGEPGRVSLHPNERNE